MKAKLYLGWDIGGANIKITVFNSNFVIQNIYFKNINIWRNFKNLNLFLMKISSLYYEYNLHNYITITAESCDNFKNREMGIKLIITSFNNYINGKNLFYTNADTYISYYEATKNIEKLFSSNWILSSKFTNQSKDFNFLIDIGSTTTDFIYKNIDIKSNINDHSRLKNRTLFYAGVVRTPLASLFNEVIYKSYKIQTVNEFFASTGDIFNIIGDIDFTSLDYKGADKKNFSKLNSYIRIARFIGLDFNTDDQFFFNKLSLYLKKLFMKKIFYNINYLSNGKLDKLKYIELSNKKISFNKEININFIYKNFTSALAVLHALKKY